MKRFLLFANYFGSPIFGGWEDFRESHDTLAEAVTAGRSYIRKIKTMTEAKWFHVVDSATGKIVHSRNGLGRD